MLTMSVKLLVLALLTPLSIAARIPVMLVGLPSGTQRLELSVLSLSPAVIATVFNVPPDHLAEYGWGSPPTDFSSDFSQVKASIEAELGSAMLSDSSLLYEQKYLIVRLNMATPTVPYDPAKQAHTAASASFANAVNPAWVGICALWGRMASRTTRTSRTPARCLLGPALGQDRRRP